MSAQQSEEREPRHIPPELVLSIVRELVCLDSEAATKLQQWDAHGGGSSRQPSSWLAVTNFSTEVENELRRVCLVSRSFAQACLPYLFRSIFVDADATRFTPARSKLLQQVVQRNASSIVALDINYPQFSNRSNSTQRVNKELRAIISQLPNLMCMQVSGMRPALSSLLRDQPDLAARMTVLHLSDLGNPMSNKTPEPDLGFLTFIKDARQLKTLVITAIDELGRSSDIESWWTSVLAPRSHPIALSLTNPPVLPQSLPSEPSDDTTESAEGHNTSGHLKHLHLNYSRRDGALDTVLRLRSMCDHFSILTTLELAGIRDWVADSALQRAALPALELLALDSISALTTDPTNRLTSLLHHWSPKKLRLGACPGFTTTELKAALASPLAASLQMVELLTGTVGLFENLESLIDFQEDLNGPPRRLEVGFDPHMIPLLEAKAIFDEGGDDSAASSDDFEPGSDSD